MTCATGEHGELATSPVSIPGRGWRQVLLRVVRRTGANNLSLVAAGVAFYSLLSIFPAIAAVMMLYGLIADPNDVVRQLDTLRGLVPGDALSIIEGQLSNVAGDSDARLTLGLLLSLALAVWGSTKGTKALMTAMNIAYDERESRGFLAQNAIALVFAVGGIIFTGCALFAIAAIPALIELLRLPSAFEDVALGLRWVVLGLSAVTALAVLYRYAPHRANARIQWLTPGALAACAFWLAASIGFSIYVTQFGRYNETFGSLGAVVTLLMWFYLTAYIVCLGAELNAELERQTMRDSTTGPPQPAGHRGAYVADHNVASHEP